MKIDPRTTLLRRQPSPQIGCKIDGWWPYMPITPWLIVYSGDKVIVWRVGHGLRLRPSVRSGQKRSHSINAKMGRFGSGVNVWKTCK